MEYVCNLKKGQQFKWQGQVYTFDSKEWSFCNCFDSDNKLVLIASFLKVEVVNE